MRPLLVLLLFASAAHADAWDGARAACGPELFSATARKQLNYVIRKHYQKEEAKIPALNRGWSRQGLGPEQRARRAFAFRRALRLECRRMMREPAEVKLVCQRDRKKYGDPNGPTFEWLVRHAKETLKTDDLNAIYENIVVTAEKSNRLVNVGVWFLSWKEWALNGFSGEVKEK